MHKRQDDSSMPDFDDGERDSLSTRFKLEAIVDVLKSIFNVACTAESLDNFQRDIRGIAPVI